MLTTRRLATAVLFIGLFAVTIGVLVDSDTFWHLRAGTWMVENARLLNFDAFSHTVAGRPWINHSWASEILMALVYRALGYGGLNLVTALVICATLAVVYQSSDADSYVRGVVVALTAVTTAIYWSARPQIVSLLMTAIFHLVLLRWRQRGRNQLWLLPPMMALWVNLHGGFAIGFLLLSVTFIGELARWVAAKLDGADDGTGRPSRAPLLWIGGIGLACAAAVALNPWGLAMLAYPFKTVSMGVLQSYIQEWKSPDFHLRSAQFFIVFWLLAFAAVGASRRRIDVTDFLSFAVFSGASLLAARNIPVFAVVTAPLVMRHAGEIVGDLKRRWGGHTARARGSRAMVAINWAVLLLVTFAVVPKASLVLGPGATEREVSRSLPVGAVEYLRTHHASGRLFNTYNYGGFLTWALGRRMPVYVDGRTDLYDDRFLNEYINVYMAGPGFEGTLAKYRIGVVLVEPNAPIARALLATPEWSLGYSDRVSVVLVKRAA
jgi:hypothetical protein